VFGDRLAFHFKSGADGQKYNMDGGNTGLLELLDFTADHFVRCLGCELLFFPYALVSFFFYLIQIEQVASAIKACVVEEAFP